MAMTFVVANFILMIRGADPYRTKFGPRVQRKRAEGEADFAFGVKPKKQNAKTRLVRAQQDKSLLRHYLTKSCNNYCNFLFVISILKFIYDVLKKYALAVICNY